MLYRFTLFILVLILLSSAVAGADWPQFRGANANGISSETGINKNWRQKPPAKLWSTPMSDGGFAGPSAVAGKVFIIDHKDGQDVIRAIDIKTGKDVWTYPYPDDERENFGYSRATPTISGGRVYALGRLGLINCLDIRNGKKLWSRDIQKDFKGKKPGWNYSMSLLVDGNKVIACPGGPDATVVALDKTTGKTIWQGGGTRELGYATPVAASINGKKQYVIFTFENVMGLDAGTGAILWSCDWRSERGAHVPQPTVIGNTVFVTNGYKQGCMLIDVGSDGAKIRWQNTEMQSHMASPILTGGYLYNNTDPGDLICMDPNTGEVKWRQPGFEKGPVIMVDGVLLALNGSNGELAMVTADAKAYKELGRFTPLGGQSWTAPIISDKKMIIRNKTELACFDLR